MLLTILPLLTDRTFNAFGVCRVGYRKVLTYPKLGIKFDLDICTYAGKWAGKVTHFAKTKQTDVAGGYWGFALPITRRDFKYDTPQEALVEAKRELLNLLLRHKSDATVYEVVIQMPYPSDLKGFEYKEFSL